MISPTGEKHGLINSIPNSIPFNDFKHMSPATKKKAEDMKKEEARIVKARYLNSRGSNERLTKPYMRWAGDNINTYHLIPGFEYDLPYGFVKEINDPNKRLKKRSEILDANGQASIKDGESEQLHTLVPISF